MRNVIFKHEAGLQLETYDLMTNPETCLVEKFEFTREPNSRAIYVGSPFYGEPVNNNLKGSLNNILLLDLNVVNFIRQNGNKSNISALLEWVDAKGINEVSPVFGLAEQQRTHKQPKYALKEYIQALEINYGRKSDEEEFQKIDSMFKAHSPEISNSIDMLRDYLVLIKYFYHQKGDLESKIKNFSGIIEHNNLPVFTFSFLIGCLFFYVKSSPKVFDKKVFSKIQKDMFISSKRETEESKLWNVASDIITFMIPIDIFWQKDINLHNFSYIASADSTIGLILNEMCIARITINDNKCLGHVGFRPSGKAFQAIAPLVNQYIPKSISFGSQNIQENSIRRNNLKQITHSLQSS